MDCTSGRGPNEAEPPAAARAEEKEGKTVSIGHGHGQGQAQRSKAFPCPCPCPCPCPSSLFFLLPLFPSLRVEGLTAPPPPGYTPTAARRMRAIRTTGHGRLGMATLRGWLIRGLILVVLGTGGGFA